MTKTARKPHQPTAKALPTGGRRIQTRRSGVHGKGVYAVADLAKGETLIEYVGEIIDWEEALRRHPHDPKDPNHTFYFHLDEDHVIDANVGGNSSRWINHSCKPNCKAEVKDGRVFIRTKKDIPAGEELFYDYGLVIDEPHTPELLQQYPCWCGSKKCRGTLLAPQEKVKDMAKDLKGKPKSGHKPKTKSKSQNKKARRT